jgi:hypothetical protein
VLVHYRRLARTAMLNNENLRLTIDSHIQCSLPSQWNVSQRAEVIVRDVPNVYILELKFCNQMPSLFKDLLRTFPLARTSFSKYRSAIDAWEVQHLAAANPARIETINHATHPCGNT